MFVLGVTGPSGAGKGTVCRILSERGFFHIDTDRLVPDIYPEALPDLIRTFGSQVESNGTIDKRALAEAAFSSPEQTEKLNKILHPLVMSKVRELIKQAEKDGFSRACVDGAALFEAHGEQICNKMLCVLAPREVRMARVVQRDQIPEKTADLRFRAQKDDSYYADRSDAVIVNESIEQTKLKIEKLIREWSL